VLLRNDFSTLKNVRESIKVHSLTDVSLRANSRIAPTLMRSTTIGLGRNMQHRVLPDKGQGSGQAKAQSN